MKTLLIGGSRERWNYKERLNLRDYINGIEAWVFALEGDYISAYFITPEILCKYDLIIINVHHTNNVYLSRIEKALSNRKTNQKIIGLIEGDASLFLSPNPKALQIFKQCDLINVINFKSLDFFKILTQKPCVYLGIPYPYDNTIKFRLKDKSINNGILACSFVSTRNLDLLVAQKFDAKVTCYEKRFSRKLKNIKLHLYKYNMININPNSFIENIKNNYSAVDNILFETSIKNYYQVNSNFYFWINLDNRFTWGRYVLDAAALAVPIITTKSTGHGELLYPETTIEDWTKIDDAIRIGQKLINDNTFYQNVIDYAINKFPDLSHESMKKKLLDLLY